MRLIGYVTSGYPTISDSEILAERYLQGGCDMLEISLPLLDNTETPYLSDLMVQAYTGCPDYQKHLDMIRKIVNRHPDVPITILLYDRVAMQIGAEKLAAFCEENGIRDVNSPGLTEPEVLRALRAHGIRVAGLIRGRFTQEDLAQAQKTEGFVYMTAFAPPQACSPGYEHIADRIAAVRKAGITNPLYCGGGVRQPSDAAVLRQAGADGVFLGTSILKMQGDPGLVDEVRRFRDAIDGVSK